MPITRAVTGNGAMAEAMRQINPDVVAAFPITPSTQIIEDFATFVADSLREVGERVGLLKIRVFRPFPYAQIARALRGVKVVTVLDRSTSMGAYGPLFGEIRTALYEVEPRPLVYNRTFGLGGRELFPDDIRELFAEGERCLQNGKVEKTFDFLNVRGD